MRGVVDCLCFSLFGVLKFVCHHGTLWSMALLLRTTEIADAIYYTNLNQVVGFCHEGFALVFGLIRDGEKKPVRIAVTHPLCPTLLCCSE